MPVSISDAIASLFPGANAMFDYRVDDDGSGPRLVEWNIQEQRPTDEQIAAEVARLSELSTTAHVPSIDRRQCRLWLLANGKTREDVEAAIAAIVDTMERETARIEWEDARVFRHDHPLMLSLAPALGIPVETLPDAFRAAAQL